MQRVDGYGDRWNRDLTQPINASFGASTDVVMNLESGRRLPRDLRDPLHHSRRGFFKVQGAETFNRETRATKRRQQ